MAEPVVYFNQKERKGANKMMTLCICYRKHNDTNVLCFGARVIDIETALKLAEIFVTTDFEKDTERHVRRVAKMAEIEKTYMKSEVQK